MRSKWFRWTDKYPENVKIVAAIIEATFDKFNILKNKNEPAKIRTYAKRRFRLYAVINGRNLKEIRFGR